MNAVIQKAIAGDKQAFMKLMNHYLPDIYNYICYKVNNEENIKDIVQEVMLAAYSAIKNFQQDSSVKTWLIVITKRKIADYYRRKYAENTVPLGDNDNYVKEETLSHVTKMSIGEAVSKLPDEDRELLHLIFTAQFSYRETAQIMNLPPGTVKSRIHYIKEKLKPLLTEDWRTRYE